MNKNKHGLSQQEKNNKLIHSSSLRYYSNKTVKNEPYTVFSFWKKQQIVIEEKEHHAKLKTKSKTIISYTTLKSKSNIILTDKRKQFRKKSSRMKVSKIAKQKQLLDASLCTKKVRKKKYNKVTKNQHFNENRQKGKIYI